MQMILTSPYTLLLTLTIITVWYFEKSEELTSIKLPSSIRDGMIVNTYDISIPFMANSRARIYYEINGKKKSTLADKNGLGQIYHYFNSENLDLIIYEDKYKTPIKSLRISQSLERDEISNFPKKVFTNPYKDIAETTKLSYFVDDDYILVNIKTEAEGCAEFDEYLAYLLDEFSYQKDLIMENAGLSRFILMVNDNIIG